jgi:hypothetical protein
MRSMRTTVDLPDELLRQAKSEAALRGRKLKDLVEEGLRLVVTGASIHEASESSSPKSKKPSAHDLLKEWCGIYKDAPEDLSTNKEYFEDFGR